MRKKSMVSVLLIIFSCLVISILLIQVLPFGRNHQNPPIVQEPQWDSPRTRELAKRACFDCHSNETSWPWYSNIAPVSWLVFRDVVEGRERLNFSDIANGEQEIGEIAEVVQEGEMPIPIYLIQHPEARLSAAERQNLVDGFTNMFGGLGD